MSLHNIVLIFSVDTLNDIFIYVHLFIYVFLYLFICNWASASICLYVNSVPSLRQMMGGLGLGSDLRMSCEPL